MGLSSPLLKYCGTLRHCRFSWETLGSLRQNFPVLQSKGTHCLDLVLNGLFTRHNFWCISGMLGNYTIPKWKEFLKSREPILRKSYLSTFIHVNKHMDGARDIFWIKSLNGTFLALQIKAFGPKNFWFSCMGKKVPFWQFFRIFKNCQNGTFLPVHENQKNFGPKVFIWCSKQ